jgi:hypothetical protein
MIYSGLDWSGTPGKAQGPLIVFAAVHIDQPAVATLDAELTAARLCLGLSEDYVFSHNDAAPRTLARVFDAIARAPLTAHAYMLNKAAWSAQQVGKPIGAKCLCDGVVTLMTRCPHQVVGGKILYIDLSGKYKTTLTHYRTEIRRALRAVRPRRPGFDDIRPCPDHRLQGGIIQAADVIAGEIRERDGLAGPYLTMLGSAVQLV